MDMIHVPVGNIAGMVFSLIIGWGLPIFLCILIKRKWKADVPFFFLGCATFFLFALVLEQLLHSFVFLKLAAVSEIFKNNVFLYALYGGMAAGVFEESGRFLVMHFFMKKNLTRENALMFGAGHGGMEAVLVLGMTSINNLISSFLLNSGKFTSSLSSDANAQKVMESLAPLGSLPAWQFFLGGIERIIAIGLHIALSLLVFQAVKDEKERYLFPLAILLHAVVDAAAVLIANYGSLPGTELASFMGTVLIGFFAWKKIWRQYK